MSERVEHKINGSDIIVDQKDGSGMWQGFPIASIPPFKAMGYFSDFNNYLADEWVVTAVGSSTATLSDEENGALVLTSAGAENDGIQLQLGNATTGESFTPESGRTIWFECKFKGGDVDQTDFFVGLAIQDTAIIASNPANMLGFISHDGDALVDFYHNASLDEGVHTLVDDTYVTVGFKMIGTDYCEYYVNGTKVGTTTSDLPATDMQLSLCMLTGEVAANTCTIEYVACYQTRND